MDLHRGGEAAEQRRHRPVRHAREGERHLVLVHDDEVVAHLGAGDRVPAHRAAVRADKPELDRQHHGLLVGLPLGRLRLLGELQRVGLGRGVESVGDGHLGRSRLQVPLLEMLQVDAVGILEHLDEGLDGGRLAVMALEVKVHALAEAGFAEQRRQHAHDLRALLVDRRGVEVVDLPIVVGARRVRQRRAVLGELHLPQRAHVLDAPDRAGALVHRELLVAVHGQALLQAELEPVAAGDPVARPVVEVLVRDDALDRGVVGIGGRRRAGEDQPVVEDVEPLVLHCAEVEIGHGDDVEDVEVVLAAEAALVPGHGALQRVHGIGALLLLAMLAIDAELDPAARGGGEAVVDRAEVAGDHGEEIGGLGKGIVPHRIVLVVAERAAVDQVAVRQQHRGEGAVRRHPHVEQREDVRAVEIVGDAPEALGLALRAPGAARAIEAHEPGVLLRLDQHLGLEHEALPWRLGDREAGRRLVIGGEGERQAVDGDRGELQPFAVEDERQCRARFRAAARW